MTSAAPSPLTSLIAAIAFGLLSKSVSMRYDHNDWPIGSAMSAPLPASEIVAGFWPGSLL